MLNMCMMALLGVEFTWTVYRIPYFLYFRLDLRNRRGQEESAVPSTLLYSRLRTWQAWHAADHARTNNVSQDHRLRVSTPLNFIGPQGGSWSPSRCRARRLSSGPSNLSGLFFTWRPMGLSEMVTNRETGYITTMKLCTTSSSDQGRREPCYDSAIDSLLVEIRNEAKSLKPLLQKSIDANRWPMLLHSKALIELKLKRQKWLCLAAGKYGMRSTLVETKFSDWLCSLDMRISAVETVYRSRGNRSPGVDGLVLTRENLLSQVKALSFNQLFKYEASPIRRVFIPKAGQAESRPLGIPTIGDRCMQTLFAQLLDPIVDATSDDFSYGFRKGRNGHQAIGDLSNHLRIKPSLKRSKKVGIRRYFSHSKYVYSIDIKGFFDNVSHTWLVENIPIPCRFRAIWSQWLTSEVHFQGGSSQVLSGFPQGSVIGPCLANFTLNGLDALCQPTQKTAFDPEKSAFLAKHYCEHYKRGQSTVRKTLVQRAYRYADDIIVVSNDMSQLSLARTRIDDFLSARGLSINPAKSFLIKWEHNQKFDFLGFTFHNVLNPVQSKITEQRSTSGELALRGGLYVYPSNASVLNFKRKIKDVITSNLNASPFTMVKTLNPIIRGWGNYYGLGTLRVFSRLDHYIYYRLWRYLRRKYKKVTTPHLVERFFQGIPTPSGRLWQFHGTYTNQTVAAKLRRGEVRWLILLCKLNTPVPVHTLKTSKALRSTSQYVDGSSHLGWHNLMIDSRSSTAGTSNNWTELYKRQKGLCPLCNTPLGYLLEDNLEIHHVDSIADAVKTNQASHQVNRLDNLMLVHKTCHKGLHR